MRDEATAPMPAAAVAVANAAAILLDLDNRVRPQSRSTRPSAASEMNAAIIRMPTSTTSAG